jgi:predicted porin
MKGPWALVIAVAATLAHARVLADAGTSLYGLLDVYASRAKGAPGGVRAGKQTLTRIESGGLTTSRFGIHGSEDLGRGLTAAFELSAFLRLDTGAVGRSDAIGAIAADPFWARESSLAVASSSFGRIRVGSFGTPMFAQSLGASAFGASTGFAPINLLTFIGSDLSGGTTWSNQIAYDSPIWGGLAFTAAVSASEGQGGHNTGARAAWSAGPAAVSLAWQNVRKNPLSFADGTSFDDTKAWQLVGAYEFESVKLFAHLGRIKNDGTELVRQRVRYAIGGFSATLALDGRSSVMVAYGRRSTKDAVLPEADAEIGGNLQREVISLGYDYFLSRRTDVYAVMMLDRTETLTLPGKMIGASGTKLGLGIRRRF